MVLRYLLFSSLVLVVDLTAGSITSSALAAVNWQTEFTDGQAALTEQNLPQAENHFRLALAQLEKQKHDTDQLAKCLNRLADTLALRNKTVEAQTTYQRLLNLLESKYGRNSTRIAPALIALGSVQESEGNHAAAMPFYQRALALNEKNYGPYSPEIVSNLHRLARSTYKAGYRAPAKEHYKRAMSILMQQPGLAASSEMSSLIGDYKDLIKGDDNSSQDLLTDFKKDMTPAAALAAASTTTVNQTKTISASSWQEQSASKMQNDHSFQTNEEPNILLRGLNQNYSDQALSPAYTTMNEAIFDQNHYGKGEDFYQRKIAADIQSLGASHPSTANDITGLALFYIQKERYSEAEALLGKSLGIYRAAYGNNNILTIRTLSTLASVKFHLGKNQEAEEMYKSALALAQSYLGPNNIETARILNDMAFLYYSQDKLKEASTYYKWAVASTESAVGQQDPLLAACLKDYAQVLHSLGNDSESVAVDARAKSILSNSSLNK